MELSDNLGDYIVTAVGGTIATLATLVRRGDVRRIDAIEKKQAEQDTHVANEIQHLRTEMRDNHNQIVGLIVGKLK